MDKFKIYLILFIIFLSNSVVNNSYAQQNYIVSTVNKLPITRLDIINRAKLISFSIDKDLKFKNLKKFYKQSLKTLINEQVIKLAGLKINKNIDKIVYKQSYELALSQYNNSEVQFNQFVNKTKISKTTILDKFKAQLIWGMVLRNKFKIQFENLDNKINQILIKKELENKEDLYDLAEITLEKKVNSQLLNKVNLALKQGFSFLDIAKQVSISNSAKYNGKIGWKSYKNLPIYIITNKIIVNESDIITFPEKDKFKIIKILVKRINGKLSKLENNVFLAQISFKINFQQKDLVYKNTKNELNALLKDKSSCNNLNKINNQNYKGLSLKIIKSRIADLSGKIQNVIQNKNLYEITEPVYFGNKGYTYIICDKQEAKLVSDEPDRVRKNMMDKQFLIFSEKLIKKLKKQANIVNIQEIR